MSKMPAVGRPPARADLGIECGPLGNRLRRTSLLPATAAAPEVAPVAEPYAFASLSSDLLLRVPRDTSSADDAADLLCRKGSASVSRWRSYDHKDTFEPAQAATAPPSDADELGSWQKYDGAPPASKNPAKTVSDDEQPTSWFKYETKPVASLLGSIENRRAKLQLTSVESAAPAPPAVPAAPVLVESAPEPDYPVAPVVSQPTVVAKVPVIEAKSPSVAEIEIEVPRSITTHSIEVAPAAEAAPTAELAPATVPELPLRKIDAPEVETTAAQDHEPELPTTAAPAPAEPERSEPAAAPENPTSTPAPSDEQDAVPTEASALEPLAIPTDDPVFDELATVPEVTEVADPTSDAVDAKPSVETPESAHDAAPLAAREPVVAASEPAITAPVAGKKAMLARLAEMLEQALSAKRAPTVDAADEPAAVLKEPVSTPSEAISDLSSDITEERSAAPIAVGEAGAPAADSAGINEPVASVVAPRAMLVEVVALQNGRGHGAEIETSADASIEAPARARAEPEPIDPIGDARPIEPKVPSSASTEPGVELPAVPLVAIEISEPSPAVLEAPSAEASPAPAPLEASGGIAAPVELDRIGELETTTEAPVAAGAEAELAPDPAVQTEQQPSQPDLAPEVVEAKQPASVRKAMLARLAEMLERALSARPARASAEPGTPAEPMPVVALSIVDEAATEAPIPAAAALPVELTATEASLTLTEPEFIEPASLTDEATVPEPADVTDEPHTGADFPSSEASATKANLNLESFPEAPAPHEQIHIEEFHDAEAAVAHEASRNEPAKAAALSGEVAGPPADNVNLATLGEQAATAASSLESGAATTDRPAEPTAEAVADLAPPERLPESNDSTSTIAAENLAVASLDDVSTPVEETSTQPVATTLDAETAPPDEAKSVRAPVPSLDPTPVAPEPATIESEISEAVDVPVLAASSAMIEAPTVVAPEISAEHLLDAVAPLETAPPEQTHEVFDPILSQTPSLDATPVAPKHEPEISETVAAPAVTASDPIIDTSEPIVTTALISAEPIVDVAAPIETAQPEGGPDASEPVPVPAFPLDAAPIAPEPSAQEPEIREPGDLSALAAPSPMAEVPEPIVVAVAAADEPNVYAVAPVETAAAETSPTPESAPATAAPPLTPAQQEKATRQALTDDLADVIHNVLSTTQFASRAMKPKRYTDEEPRAEEPELPDLTEELTASLPHPVAIPPRFGRMERGIAFVSVAMMLAVGYFAFSLWQGAGSPSAQAAARAPAVVVTAPHSEDWGERARDMTRGLNSIAVVRDAPSAQTSGPAPTAGARPQGPETAQ